jgi:hypothetical protein
MKTFYIKAVLLGVVGLIHGTSACMLKPKLGENNRKTTKKAIKIVNLLEETNSAKNIPLALPPQRPTMESNFFTELPKELRSLCVLSRRPNKDIVFINREVDFLRNTLWLQEKINVSSTSRYSRFVMLRDDAELASFIKRSNGVRLEPNPTAAIKIGFERGLEDKAGLRHWHNDQTEYERSHESSMECYVLMEMHRYNQENPPLIKCSIQ